MSTQINNVKIALRYDTLENWMQANPLLLQGEYTAVILPDSSIRIKIGDGVHTFNELPFIGSCVSVISGDVPFSNDLSVVKLTNEEYNKLVAEKKINPAALYVITDNYTSMRGAQLKDLGQPTDDNDAATKKYIDDNILNIPKIDLSEYYKKTETSSNIEISNRFDDITKIGSYLSSTGYSLSSNNLSVVNISEEDYLKLIAEEQQDDNVIYVVSSDNLNARNERVVNVAEPIADDDAATKQYVDGKLLYKITTKDVTLSSVNIDGSDVQAYVAYVDNNAINVIQLHSNSYPLFVYLPKQLEENYVRDLLVRVEVYTATAPSIGFFGISEVCEFESEDDEWMMLEPGVNMFNFTETRK